MLSVHVSIARAECLRMAVFWYVYAAPYLQLRRIAE